MAGYLLKADFLAELHLAFLNPVLPVLTLPVHLHSGIEELSQNASSPHSEMLKRISCSTQECLLLRAIGSTGKIMLGGELSGRE
jgi:hypothetical protein